MSKPNMFSLIFPKIATKKVGIQPLLISKEIYRIYLYGAYELFMH